LYIKASGWTIKPLHAQLCVLTPFNFLKSCTSLRRHAMDWRHKSACRDEDPELFFPVGNTGPALTQIEEAKKVCNRCIVKEPCLAWALESGQDAGVWGGLSEDERRALKRRAARNRARLMEQQNHI
jgi:WhiB family redox-sensing transcriptional regulator